MYVCGYPLKCQVYKSSKTIEGTQIVWGTRFNVKYSCLAGTVFFELFVRVRVITRRS